MGRKQSGKCISKSPINVGLNMWLAEEIPGKERPKVGFLNVWHCKPMHSMKWHDRYVELDAGENIAGILPCGG